MISKNFVELNKKKPLTVFVVGDCLVDEYYDVHVSRISPEFPIQVLQSENSEPEALPGGAANVAHQFKHFQVNCHLFGCLNEYAKSLYSSFPFNLHAVDINGIVPIKRRLYDGSHALTRWDIEKPNYGVDDMTGVREQLIKKFISAIEASPPDFVIFADYAKGLFSDECAQQFMQVCQKHNIKSIVDPKKGLHKWKGCTVFKPNAKEAANLTGKSEVKEQIEEIKRITGCSLVIVTQSGQGVHVGSDEYEFIHGNKVLEVQSVIGAGDCFSAFLAMGLHYFGYGHAVKLAFNAGLVYVQNRHNKPITPHELLSFSDPIQSKIVALPDLPDLTNKNVIITNGVYDVVHIGHTELLNWAKSHGDVLIVAINDDDSVRRLKGNNRPINTLDNRMRLLANFHSVDFVIPFSEDTPYELYKKIYSQTGQFKFLVKGGDYKVDDVVGKEFASQVVIFPTIPKLSTTNILEKIKCTHS